MFETLRVRARRGAAFFVKEGLSFLLVCLPGVLLAQSPLFPTPLHLTREIDDPITRSRFVIEEYFQGNRAIAIRGDLTAITDYEKNEFIRIDRATGTYSITSFDELAKARRTDSSSPSKKSELVVRSVGSRTMAGRNASVIEASREVGGVKRRLEVALDREISMSADALDVVIGVAYPGNANEDSSDLALAIRGSRQNLVQEKASGFPLPLEQIVDYEIDGQTVRSANRVSRVGNELAPLDRTTIPAGARRVVDSILQLPQVTRDLDSLVSGAGTKP